MKICGVYIYRVKQNVPLTKIHVLACDVCTLLLQMQMLHCVEQAPTKGGDNVLADGFNAAYVLKGMG